MKYVLIIHEVDEYVAWQKGFDAASDLRKSAGEVGFQVLKYEDNPNKIVNFSQWTTLEAAKAFFESDQVVKIRHELGVKTPKFIYLDELESGVL